MPQKRLTSPPKHPSPPRSSSSTSSEEEEEENHNTGVSTPISSQLHKKPISRKPTSDLNRTPNPDSSTEEDDEEEEDSEDEMVVRSQSRPAQPRKEKEDDEEEEDSDESGSDSDSDSDSPPQKVKSAHPSRDSSVKPISSKPMEGASKPKKGAVNPTVAAAASPAPKPSPHKRSSASDLNEKESKKRQKSDLVEEDEEASPKKPLFQRIWSPEDEISILKAMIEFMKRGSDISSDLTGFHELVKKSLNVDMTKNQVTEKIRRMKKKYQNLAEKATKGKEPSFSKAHDNLIYQLSKQIWGNDGEGENSVEKKGRGNSKRSKNTVEPKSSPSSKSLAPKSLELNENGDNHTPENHGLKNIEVLYPHLNDSLHSGGIVSVGGFGESDVKRALALMGDSRVKEWDERWMKLRSKEKDVYMERATLVYELMKECYDLVKSSKK